MKEIASLEFDLAVLMQTQSRALETSPYLKMCRASQLAYNDRRKRIATLREAILNMKLLIQNRMRPKRAA